MATNSVQREKRRRRVLREDTGEVRKSQRPKTNSNRRYSDGALEEAQPRVTDWLPRQTWQLGVTFAIGVVAVLSLHVVYRWQAAGTVTDGRPLTPAFNLAAAGSIGAWFGSVMSLSCSFLSLMIFNIRRHRIADYRGRYRFWLWAALIFGIASVTTVARFDLAVATWMFNLTGGRPFPSPTAWVIGGWALLSLTVAVPLLLELRMSQLTISGLLAAGLCYAASALLYVGVFRGQTVVTHVAWQVSFLYFGHVLALTSLYAFARLVFLDAQGELTRKPRRERNPIQPPAWVVAWASASGGEEIRQAKGSESQEAGEAG